MKTSSFTLLLWVLILQPILVSAQTENYEKGLDAIQANRYHEAMISFTKVVENEKFEITGKDLSMAYAYLAIIRTAYLEKDLMNASFNDIMLKQGHIQQTIHEMVRAIKFQDKNTKSLIDGAKATLVEVSTNTLKIIGDSLLTYDENQPTEGTNFLANFAIKQFGELEDIAVDNWQLHDILGLAHYYLGEKEKAMKELEVGREQFSILTEQPNSALHLKNYVLSGNHYFKTQNNLKEAYKICDLGSAYTSALINDLGDDQMNEILRLNKIENRFRQYMTRIKESGI